MLIFSACALLVRDYLFPLKYEYEVQKYAYEYNVDVSLVCAVINCESGFDSYAVSKKGAVGLMQIMPSTAKWCAKRLGMEYKESELYTPEYNIRIGTFYLSYLFQKFGDERLVLCAYNAGEGNVTKWLNENRIDVPFDETRGYVPRVLFNKRIYNSRFK